MSETVGAGRHAVVLGVAYDGADFHGFAAQLGQRTVASELLTALQAFDPKVTKLRVASRTDAGVHAREQCAAFDTERVMPMRAWVLGVGKLLPRDVALRSVERAEAGYHPRYETKRKRYRYLVHAARLPDPLLARRAWRVHGLDRADERVVRSMADELSCCIGTHDFAGFASSADERAHTVRTMSYTSVARLPDRDDVIAIDVEGDGFLHNMVRILVGTVVDVGLGRTAPGAITRTLASRTRFDAGQTAPPDGLYLERLEFARRPGADRWPSG